MASTSSFLQLHLPHKYHKFSPLSSSSSSRSFNNNNNISSSTISISSPSSIFSPISVNSNIFGDVNSREYANAGVCFGIQFRAAIEVYDDESEEELVRRFKRVVSRAGIIQECRRRRHYENKHDERKRKLREAGLRNRRRKFGPRPYFGSEGEGEVVAKKDDDDDDNWKYSE